MVHDHSELDDFVSVAVFLDRLETPVFATRSSFEWFVKRNRAELVRVGALITREGRSGSLVSKTKFPKAVVAILKRRARQKIASARTA